MAGTLSITISSDRISELARILKLPPEKPISKDTLEAAANLAFNSWLDVLLGPMRPHSLTELYLMWLRNLHRVLLPRDQPSERHLSVNFNFPYAQAAYLARILRQEQPSALRRVILEELSRELAALSKAIKSIKVDPDEPDQGKSVRVTKAARDELTRILGELCADGKEMRPIRTEGVMGDYVAILVPVQDVAILLERVNQQLAQVKKEATP
jgi:hypothetical protein